MVQADWSKLDWPEKKEFRAAVTAWHATLEDNRGVRAELRRAKSVNDALFTEAYQSNFLPVLRNHDCELAMEGVSENKRTRVFQNLAMAAALISHVKTVDPARSFAQLMGTREGDSENSALVHPARFRRLMAVEPDEKDELLRMLIRLIRMTGGAANLRCLLDASFCWNDSLRAQWALAYYGHASAKSAKQEKE